MFPSSHIKINGNLKPHWGKKTNKKTQPLRPVQASLAPEDTERRHDSKDKTTWTAGTAGTGGTEEEEERQRRLWKEWFW